MSVLSYILSIVAILLSIILYLRSSFQLQIGSPLQRLHIGIMHPACNAGGGGEKVLWSILISLISALKKTSLKYKIVIYSGETGIDKQTMMKRAEEKFNLEGLDSCIDQIDVIVIGDKKSLSPGKFMTVLIQIVQQIRWANQCIQHQPVHILIDTQGYPFTYPLFKLLSSSYIISYTHYPFISSDMLSSVSNRNPSFNNPILIHSSYCLSSLKYIYYLVLYYLYVLLTFSLDLAIANSSWTFNHLKTIWPTQSNIALLFPPCNTYAFQQIPINNPRHTNIISFAQFRPEKNHKMQLDILSTLLKTDNTKDIKMIIIGSCRDNNDYALLDSLRVYAQQLGIADRVSFEVNQEFKQVVTLMSNALIAIHTMKDEHFGISVVELMAAGVITIAHNSAGPRMDIIGLQQEQTGYLADTLHDYVNAIQMILNSHSTNSLHNNRIRIEARNKVNKFSHQQFHNQFQKLFNDFLKQHKFLA